MVQFGLTFGHAVVSAVVCDETTTANLFFFFITKPIIDSSMRAFYETAKAASDDLNASVMFALYGHLSNPMMMI